MKKLIALILSVILICCFSVTAFAAESPTAGEKITVQVIKGTANNSIEKEGVPYTFEKGIVTTFKSDEKQGTFNSWTIYKVEGNAAVLAVEGVDYEIIAGGLESSEITIKIKSSFIVCGNYNNVKTDPTPYISYDGSSSAPQTGDMSTVCIMVIMLAVAALGFSAKKVYSK